MDNLLHKKYKNVAFEPEQVAMFADIVMADEAVQKTFLKIGEMTKKTGREEEHEIVSVAISDIARTVKINRKVKRTSGSYEQQYTYMDQKHAERVANILLGMSLCYYRPVAKTKLINYTFRGNQVAAEIIKRIRNEKKKQEGEMTNVVQE